MTGTEWAAGLNQAALVYNEDDAGPTVEYPGLRVFVYLEPDGTLAVNIWTRDTDEDPSLATADDLCAHIPVELYRDDHLVHRDAPTPSGGVNASNSAGPGTRDGSAGGAKLADGALTVSVSDDEVIVSFGYPAPARTGGTP